MFLAGTLDLASGKGAIHDGDEDERQHRGEGEAADDADAKRTPELGALAATNRHRQHAEDGGERGHEHRTQTAAAGSDDGLQHALAALAAETDVVDEHNAVLHHDAQQQHDAEGAHEVERGAREPEGDEHAADTEGHAEHDDERVGETLELGCHDDVNEHEDEQTEHEHVGEGVLLLLDVARDADGDAQRDVVRVDDSLAGSDNLAHGGAALDDGGDGVDALAVLTLDGGRREALDHRADVLDADGVARRAVEEDVLNVLNGGAELGSETHLDVVLLAVLAVVRGGGAVDAVAEVGGGGGHVEAVTGEFLAVELDVVFGLVLVAADAHLGHAGLFLQFGAQHLGHGVGLGEVPAIDLEGHGALSAHARAAAGADGEALNLGTAAEVLTDDGGNVEGGHLALAGVLEADVVGDDVGAVALHGGEGVVLGGLANGVVDDAALGAEVAPPLLGQLLGHGLAALGARPDGHPHFDAQTAVVARGEELGAQRAGGEEADAEEDDAHADDDGAMTHTPVEAALIPAVEAVEEALDGAVELLGKTAALLLQLQHLRAEHGGEREGAGGGDGEDDAHHPAELAEHHTGHALHHGQRQEHRQHGERGGNDGDGHLVGGVYGSLLGVGTALDVGGGVLQHHDGIVDHQSDGDGEARERDDVQRAAAQQQVYERGNERQGDGDGNDERGPPTAQEEQHHQHHEQQGEEHRPLQRADGVHDALGRVVDHADVDVAGEVALQLGQHLLHLVADFHGVGTRLFLHDDGGTAHAVGERHLATLLQRIDHLGHVAQVDVTASHGGHDDVPHLARVVELPFHTEGVGLVADVERAARDVAVLLRDDAADGLDGEVVGLELHGVAIDVNLTLGGTADADATHARDACQGVGHVLVENLVEAVDALLGLHGHDDDGHHLRVELEDDGVGGAVGEGTLHHVEFVADVVRQVVDVEAVLKL